MWKNRLKSLRHNGIRVSSCRCWMIAMSWWSGGKKSMSPSLHQAAVVLLTWPYSISPPPCCATDLTLLHQSPAVLLTWPYYITPPPCCTTDLTLSVQTPCCTTDLTLLYQASCCTTELTVLHQAPVVPLTSTFYISVMLYHWHYLIISGSCGTTDLTLLHELIKAVLCYIWPWCIKVMSVVWDDPDVIWAIRG